MLNTQTETAEQRRDAAHAAADAAAALLEAAQAAVAEAKAQLDGSDAAYRSYEKAKAQLERRQAEFNNLEARFMTVEQEIAAIEREKKHARLEAARVEADHRRAQRAIRTLAARYVAHAVELQAGREAARRLAREQAAAVREARELGDELTEVVIASALTDEESELAFDHAIARAAREQNVVLEVPTWKPPIPLRREVGNEQLEDLVAVPRLDVERSRIRASLWRELDLTADKTEGAE